MAPKSLDPWLAQCLEDELTAVIEWKQQLLRGIKPDPESRFSDDGSNFRSEVTSPPGTAAVQLIRVLTSDAAVTAYVSDGIMKVKVRLSEDAAATFEEESGGPITPEVSGDVFRLEKFTIVSTPFGPADGFVQLHVDEISYQTLRRGIFDGMPVERDYSIRKLIESTKLLRMPERAHEGLQNRPQPGVAPAQDNSGRVSSNATQTQGVVQTQAAVLTPSAAAGQTATQTQYPVPVDHTGQAQAPIKRKAQGPTLGQDGFEVERGLNLHGPVEPMSRETESAPADKQAVNPLLVSLLRGSKASESVTTAGSSTEPRQKQQSLAAPENPISLATKSSVGADAAVVSTAQKTLGSLDIVPEELWKPASGGDFNDKTVEDTNSHTTSSTQRLAQSSQAATTTDSKSLFAYARRKVPDNQRKLLDNPASWLPSLPGRQFPKPNVPIELLSIWNAEAAGGPPDPILSQRSVSPPSQQPESPSEVLTGSDSDSEHSDDATQEYPPSPVKNWRPRQAGIPPATAVDSSIDSDASMGNMSRPPSESPRRPVHPDMPPSSTLGSVIRGTPLDGELEVVAPRPLPVRRSPQKRKADELSQLFPKRHALPPKPEVIVPGSPVSAQSSAHRDRPSFQKVTGSDYPMPPPKTYTRGRPEWTTVAALKSSCTSTPVAAPTQGSLPWRTDPVTELTSDTSARRPTKSEHFGPRHWQASPSGSLPGLFLASQQSSVALTSHRPAQDDLQTSKPLELFKQGFFSPHPPFGPRFSLPHTFQSTQSPQSASTRIRDRSSEREDQQQSSAVQLHEANERSPNQVSVSSPLQSTIPAQPQARETKLLDVTDATTERFSASLSPEQVRSEVACQSMELTPAPSSWRPHAVSTQLRFGLRPNEPAVGASCPKSMLSARKTWLKSNYIASGSGALSLPTVLERYRTAFPADTSLNVEDLLEAARYAFERVNVTSEMRYIPKSSSSQIQAAARKEVADALKGGPSATSSSKSQQEGKGAQNSTDPHGSSTHNSYFRPQDPALMQRQARTRFMNEERRKAWLRTTFVPASNGTVPLTAVLDQYSKACPEDDRVQLQMLLSAAQTVYYNPDPESLKITSETPYMRKLQTMGTARTRSTEYTSKTGETVVEQARRSWLKENYKPAPKGTLQLVTLLDRYKHSCPDDDDVAFDDVLKAGRAAWPDQGVTAAMHWLPKSELTQPPQGSLAAGSAANGTKRKRKSCLTWFRSKYSRDLQGDHSLFDLFVAYKQQAPGALNPQHLLSKKKLLSVITNAVGIKKKRGKELRFSTISAATDSVPRGEASESASNIGKGIGLEDMCSWLQCRYQKDWQGSLVIDDMIQAYRQENTGCSVIQDETFAKALRQAFGCVAKIDRFSRLDHDAARQHSALLPPQPQQQDSGLDGGNSRSSMKHEAHDSRHGRPVPHQAMSGANSCSSAPQPELRYDSKTDHRQPTLEASSSVAQFCASYLAIRPGKGNAFGKYSPKSVKKRTVDVLSWDI